MLLGCSWSVEREGTWLNTGQIWLTWCVKTSKIPVEKNEVHEIDDFLGVAGPFIEWVNLPAELLIV